MLKYINMRLDKFLSKALSLSRNDVKKIVKQKRVKINGEICIKVDHKVDENNDKIVFDDNLLEYREYIYLMMNKPMDVISATFDNKDKTVIDLLEDKYRFFEPFPVGRLDKDTVGLLLLTNDGKLSHNLLSPKKHVSKKYYVESLKELSNIDIEMLENGVDIGGYITKKSKIEILENGKYYLTITEGKFHQIKRMFEAVNNKVIYLERVQFANLKLDRNLKKGEYRELTKDELDGLLKGR